MAHHHVLEYFACQAESQVLARREAAHAVSAEGVHTGLVECGPGSYIFAKVPAHASNSQSYTCESTLAPQCLQRSYECEMC